MAKGIAMVAAPNRRLSALRRLATAITVLNVAGHTFLGFETSWAQVIVAAVTAYSVELVLETVDSLSNGRRPRFLGGVLQFADFLLPAHITAFAVSMLMYSNNRLLPFAFAAAVAIASKAIFVAPVDGAARHFLNPSNTGLIVTVVLFQWTSIVVPYHFTENLKGSWSWALPVAIVFTGTLINALFTGKIPLVLSWLTAFALQAIGRALFFGTPIRAGLMPMTGVAFVLFTFYMITDPGSTPSKKSEQIAFGASVAGAYMCLMLEHIVFGLFLSLFLVCSMRGAGLYLLAVHNRLRSPVTAQQQLAARETST